MRKWIYILMVLFLFSCKEDSQDIYMTPEKAAWYFSQIETICYEDGGKLWGKNIYGPLMFIDRTTRKVVANMPDSSGILKLKEGVYTGIYPKELLISNSYVDFGGTMYAMAPLPEQEDTLRIKTRAVIGLFQCFQKRSGLEPQDYYTSQMDEKTQRLFLKLEWRALRKSIESDGENRKQSLRDALIFRGARREQNSKEIMEENKFETYKGLASFTSAVFCNKTDRDIRKYLVETLNRFYSFNSYTRSYGSIHGALYACLAYEKGYDFKLINSDSIDLANLTKELYEIDVPEICRDIAGSIAVNYDLESIYKEEEERLAANKERMHRQVEVFTEKPVVFLELESPYFDFEPEDIRSIDTLGTIYTSIRISDNWGKLTVDQGGCLVSFNLKTMRITAKNFKESKNHFYGDGWHLILNSDWQVTKVEDNYFVRKMMP
jgi:hypothetical protein